MKSGENRAKLAFNTCHGLSSGNRTTALPIFLMATTIALEAVLLGQAHRLALAVLEQFGGIHEGHSRIYTVSIYFLAPCPAGPLKYEMSLKPDRVPRHDGRMKTIMKLEDVTTSVN